MTVSEPSAITENLKVKCIHGLKKQIKFRSSFSVWVGHDPRTGKVCRQCIDRSVSIFEGEIFKHFLESGYSMDGDIWPDSCDECGSTPCKCPAKAGNPSADFQEVCIECGHKFGVWFAENPVWNEIIPGRVGMLCPCCFIARADKGGFKTTGWKMVPMDNPLGEESVEIERAEPSRGAPEAARNTVDQFAATIVNRLRAQDFYEEWRNSKAAKAEFDYVEREGFCECEWAFAEAYAKSGHVVLLEALRGLMPFIRERGMKGESDWERAVLVAEAAIQQAERA